jgi:hypothetical protein
VDAGVAAPEDRQRGDGFAGDRRRVHPADDRIGLGLVAKDWAKEVGINYAPPSWITLGATDAPPPALPGGAAEPSVPAGPTPGSAFNSTVVDPLADVIAELKGGKPADAGRCQRR